MTLNEVTHKVFNELRYAHVNSTILLLFGMLVHKGLISLEDVKEIAKESNGWIARVQGWEE